MKNGVRSYRTYSRKYFSCFITKLLKLFRKGRRYSHRGVIGMEAAIVLIAFVIVAAALAFVVLNMGFATTQKAKTSITFALGEAGSGISISSSVVGDSFPFTNLMTAVMIPLKITTGGESIDLNTTKATISYLSNDVEYGNIYRDGCTETGATYATPDAAWNAAEAGAGCIAGGENPISDGFPFATTAIIYWAVSQQAPPNTILEQGEHAILSIGWNATDAPSSLDKFKVELTVTGGATLTIDRDIPNISGDVIDLG
jgi:flagellin FlaB